MRRNIDAFRTAFGETKSALALCRERAADRAFAQAFDAEPLPL